MKYKLKYFLINNIYLFIYFINLFCVNHQENSFPEYCWGVLSRSGCVTRLDKMNVRHYARWLSSIPFEHTDLNNSNDHFHRAYSRKYVGASNTVQYMGLLNIGYIRLEFWTVVTRGKDSKTFIDKNYSLNVETIHLTITRYRHMNWFPVNQL